MKVVVKKQTPFSLSFNHLPGVKDTEVVDWLKNSLSRLKGNHSRPTIVLDFLRYLFPFYFNYLLLFYHNILFFRGADLSED